MRERTENTALIGSVVNSPSNNLSIQSCFGVVMVECLLNVKEYSLALALHVDVPVVDAVTIRDSEQGCTSLCRNQPQHRIDRIRRLAVEINSGNDALQYPAHEYR